MNIESYAFTLLAAVSGMMVVFVILTFLSAMMLFMALVVPSAANAGLKSKRPQAAITATDKGQPSVAATDNNQETVVSLVMIAAAAHLHSIAERERQSAASWRPSSELSPWGMV